MSKDVRTAYYPACGTDIVEPICLVKGYVERFVFCDSKPINTRKWDTILKDESIPVEPIFIQGHAREVFVDLPRVDVFFSRRDGFGEGGSGLPVFSKEWLSLLMDRLPPSGGYIVSDGWYLLGHNFSRMKRERGLTLGRWHFRMKPDQGPFASAKLYLIEIIPMD